LALMKEMEKKDEMTWIELPVYHAGFPSAEDLDWTSRMEIR
jgi:hypothetical protein